MPRRRKASQPADPPAAGTEAPAIEAAAGDDPGTVVTSGPARRRSRTRIARQRAARRCAACGSDAALPGRDGCRLHPDARYDEI